MLRVPMYRRYLVVSRFRYKRIMANLYHRATAYKVQLEIRPYPIRWWHLKVDLDLTVRGQGEFVHSFCESLMKEPW